MGFFTRNDIERRRQKSPARYRAMQQQQPVPQQAPFPNGGNAPYNAQQPQQQPQAPMNPQRPMTLQHHLQQQQQPPPQQMPQQMPQMAPQTAPNATYTQPPPQQLPRPAAFPAPYEYNAATMAECQQITPNIWLGSCRAVKLEFLQSNGIKYVINAAKELKQREIVDWEGLKKGGIVVMHVGWEDSLEQQLFPSPALNDAVMWIDQIIGSGNKVLIHCAQGKSRSTSLVIAYLLIRQGYTYDQAIQTVQAKRPIAQPNSNFERQLRNVERSVDMRNKQQIPAQPQSPQAQPGQQGQQMGSQNNNMYINNGYNPYQQYSNGYEQQQQQQQPMYGMPQMNSMNGYPQMNGYGFYGY